MEDAAVGEGCNSGRFDFVQCSERIERIGRRVLLPCVAVLLALAVGWFAWQLYTMPDPDLAGLPRNIVMIVFVGASLLTYIYMPDFLSVRCLAVLMLFLARLTLDAGYRQLPYSLLDASVS